MQQFLKVLLTLLVLAGISQAELQAQGIFENQAWLGVRATQPYLKNGFQATGPWTGGSFRYAMIGGSFTQGFLYEKGTENSEPRTWGYMFDIGGVFPLFKQKAPEGLDINTFRVIPMMHAGLSYAKAGRNGTEYTNFSAGVKLSPGLQIRASFLTIEVNPDVHLLLNRGSIIGHKKFDNTNAFKGFAFSPSITVGFDGLFNLMNPSFHHQKVRTIENRSRTEKTGETTNYEVRGDYLYKRTTSHYKTTRWKEEVESEYNFFLIDPYFSLGPRLTLLPEGKQVGSSLLVGPQIGTRFGMFGLDGWWQTGKVSIRNGVDQESLQALAPNQPNFNFRASQQLHWVGAALNIDLIKWGIPANRRRKISRNITTKYTSFLRLNIRTSYQYQFMGEAPEFVEADAPALLEQALMEDPTMQTDLSRNPELLREEMGAIGIGVGLEMGVVGITYDYQFTKKKAPLYNRHQLSISTNIPWIKAFRGLSAKRSEKRMARQRRKEAKKKNDQN